MTISITTLTENTASAAGLAAEWGLSILIETDEATVLFDTGHTDSAVRNALALGVELSRVDRIVLSHGHPDHTGGLRDVLKAIGKQVEVVAHPDVWRPKYIRRAAETLYRYIGIPFRREELEGLGASFQLTTNPLWISDTMVTTGEIPMTAPHEQIDAGLYTSRAEVFVPDPLADDLALVLKTPAGLVLVCGCAHRGLVNTIRQARAITGVQTVDTVLGGTHLLRATADQVDYTIAQLKKMDIKRLGVSHCTGFHASARLAAALGDRFFLNNAGTRLELP